MVSILLKNLSKNYGSKRALENTNLEIRDREIFCIIGPSGSGKTSLLRLISGLESPTAGSIHFNGKDVTNVKANARNIGMVFQDYALWPHLNVYGNISLVLNGKMSRGEEKAKVSGILEKVGLGHKIDSRISELSGGEMQRVALARALVMKPDILLMDEPLSNLDAKIKKDLTVETLKIIREFNITTIFVTHAQEEAYEMADRLAVMNDGKICQIGIPEEVYLNPESVFVADFMSESILSNVQVKSSSDSTISMDSDLGDILFSVMELGNDNFSGVMVVRINTLEVVHKYVEKSFPALVLDYRFNSGHFDLLLQLPNGRIIRKIVNEKTANAGETVYLKLPPGGYFIFRDGKISLPVKNPS